MCPFPRGSVSDNERVEIVDKKGEGRELGGIYMWENEQQPRMALCLLLYNSRLAALKDTSNKQCIVQTFSLYYTLQRSTIEQRATKAKTQPRRPIDTGETVIVKEKDSGH